MQPAIGFMREAEVDAVARLRFDAFFRGSARTLEEDAAGLRALIGSDGAEAAFVARVDGTAVGSALLVRRELEPAHDLTPWLAGLVVAEPQRGKGIGEALVRAVERRAAAAGFAALYLYTWEAQGFYGRLGWHPVETFRQEGEPMMLMSRGDLHSLPAT
ncbi:MAG TPA: GNAT family N-acetyltransferase [Rhizobiaceae bacterium]